MPAPHIEPWLATTRKYLQLCANAPFLHPRNNLTISQRLLLRSLRSDSTIIIRPADKNLGLTILNASDYHAEIRQQLNSLSYQQLTTGIVPTASIHRNIINRFQQAYNDKLIDERILKFISQRITPDTAVIPRFYTLPKIHKPGPLRGRPIVPSHSWITTPVSIWIDSILQPYVKQIPTICTSSTAIILDLQHRKLSEDCTLITADVASLYTNIPTYTGVAFVRKFATEFCKLATPMVNLLCDAFTLVLNNNYFQAVGTTFLQKTGTAMGTPAAVVFANIFMFVLENKTVSKYANNILYYKRFLDDILLIVRKETADHTMHSLSNMHPAIKLEFKRSQTHADFLDIHMFKGTQFNETGILSTSVHQKLLNAYLYIPFCSFHSPKAKGAFIITELMRYVRLCSNRQDYVKIKQLFFQRLRARGYPANFLAYYMQRVQYAQRPQLLQPRSTANTSQSSPVFFTCQWNPLTKRLPLKRILTQYTTGMVNMDIMIGYKRTPNLLGLLQTRPPGLARANPMTPIQGPNNPNNLEAR